MTTGRAGFDVRHKTGGGAKNRQARSNLLHESARHLDDADIAKQAARNINVDPSRTSGNVLMVNAGDGAFAEGGIEEVLEYGDAREARVRRKISEKSKTTTTFVVHLPKSMCEPKVWVTPEGKKRRYFEARDEDEMMRYFDEAVSQLGEHVLAGGMDAIHGYALNVDEYTPHIQIIADTFDDDTTKKAKEGDLRVAYSDMWSQSRNVKNADGKMILGKAKLSGYQADFRQRMHDAGFPVELEADPLRSARRLDKADYIKFRETGRAAKQMEKRANEARKQAVGQINKLDQLKEVELPALRADAVKRGHNEGYITGYDEGVAEAEAEYRAARVALARERRAVSNRQAELAQHEREVQERVSQATALLDEIGITGESRRKLDAELAKLADFSKPVLDPNKDKTSPAD